MERRDWEVKKIGNQNEVFVGIVLERRKNSVKSVHAAYIFTANDEDTGSKRSVHDDLAQEDQNSSSYFLFSFVSFSSLPFPTPFTHFIHFYELRTSYLL
jgi:hypothetical protein